MKKWVWIILGVLIIALGSRSCGTKKASPPVEKAALEKTEDEFPVLAQNQVPKNPHVQYTPSVFPERSAPDPKDSFESVPEEKALENTPYGKHQM